VQPATVVDITRPFEVLATCPTCRMVRTLPEDWQQIMARTAPDGWDGSIQCCNGHPVQEMILTPVRNPRYEADGSILSHLVMDEDHRRALCTGELWAGVPDDAPAGTLVRLCQACQRIATCLQ
jgi:hypothetical protein